MDEVFGEAGLFNGWFRNDFISSSDTEGRLAAGGNIILEVGYSVGDKMPPMNCSDTFGDTWNTTTVAGGYVSWPSGRNYFGNIAVGDYAGSSIGEIVEIGLEPLCEIFESDDIVDFETTHTCLINKSEYLSQLTSPYTATVNFLYSGRIDVVMPSVPETPETPVVIVDIPQDKFNSAYELNMFGDDLRESTIIVVNVPGETIDFGGFAMTSWTSRRNYIIWNFYEATTMNVGSIEVEGTIMAPNADFVNNYGVIQGQIFGNSFTGPMQINNIKFEGCFDFTGVC